jgi:competence protein ComEC
MNWRALPISTLLLLGAAGGAQAQETPLKIVAIDVEGGTATLMVTPQGRSVLFDAGWPPGRGVTRAEPNAPAGPAAPSNTQRIVAAAKMLGLSKIDYMLTTHYHVDHIGGVIDLASQFPIGTYIDHGPNREIESAQSKSNGPNSTVLLYDAYRKAIAGKPHREMKAGDTLKIGDLVLTAVVSDRVVSKPLPGAGGPGVGCDRARPHEENDEIENQHSLGVLATYGRARVLSLADQVWNVENELVCPIDRIGKVDVMFVSNHGTNTSTSPTVIDTLKPTVMLMSNGVTKGGSADVLKTLHTYPSMDVWQLHFAVRTPELNYPQEQIANVAPTPNENWPLHINVLKSGTVTVANARNGFSKTYPKARP